MLLACANLLANADFRSPPRFDGAGYAALGLAVARGEGYREIEHPDRPEHDHFPPAYPALLAAIWRWTGPSFPAAHLLSLACTLGAIAAAWAWFGRCERPGIAWLLAMALAANWSWGRLGTSIQSEPAYFLLAQWAILLAMPPKGLGKSAVLGIVLALASLTRQVGLALALGLGLHLIASRRFRDAFAAWGLLALGLIPWVAWQWKVHRRPQAGLLGGDGSLASLVADQALFYLRRIPDQIIGPVVEVATVFSNRPALGIAATAGAAVATGVILWGALRMLRAPERRPAAATLLATLALLLAWPFTEAGRFLAPLIPCLLVAAVEGGARVFAILRLRNPRRAAAVLVLAASLPYPLYATFAGRAAAQRGLQADFDAGCRWIAEHGGRIGPVLARHPADVFWLTGREALAPASDDPDAVAEQIRRYDVAYLIVDSGRYARAEAGPLARFASERPGMLAQVWPPAGEADAHDVAVWEVVHAP